MSEELYPYNIKPKKRFSDPGVSLHVIIVLVVLIILVGIGAVFAYLRTRPASDPQSDRSSSQTISEENKVSEDKTIVSEKERFMLAVKDIEIDDELMRNLQLDPDINTEDFYLTGGRMDRFRFSNLKGVTLEEAKKRYKEQLVKVSQENIDAILRDEVDEALIPFLEEMIYMARMHNSSLVSEENKKRWEFAVDIGKFIALESTNLATNEEAELKKYVTDFFARPEFENL